MQPRFVDLAELNLVGLPYYGTPAEGKFTETWYRFFALEPSIQNRVDPKVYYGVELYDKELMPGQGWHLPPGRWPGDHQPEDLHRVHELRGCLPVWRDLLQ